jgi:hypothetical protein
MARRKTVTITIDEADPASLAQVEELTRRGESETVKALAKGILEVAKHCASIQSALFTIAKNVEFNDRAS